MGKIKLREICHSRAGDKGDISNLSLIVYDQKDYPFIEREVTVECVKEYFQDLVKGSVTRYELPKIGALNFVMEDALGGGATRSLRIDQQGKTFSSIFLDLQIEDTREESG